MARSTRSTRSTVVVPATPVVSANLSKLEVLRAKAKQAEGLDRYKRQVKEFCDFMLECAKELEAMPVRSVDDDLLIRDCLHASPETCKVGGKHRHQFLEFCKENPTL